MQSNTRFTMGLLRHALFALFIMIIAIMMMAAPAVVRAQNLYISDVGTYWSPQGYGTINKITPDGTVSLLANLPVATYPEGMACDSAGYLYMVGEVSNVNGQLIKSQILKISPDGDVRVFATLPLAAITGLAIDRNDNFYVADLTFERVLKMTVDGVISVFAVLPTGTGPSGLASDSSGNLYTSDYNSSQISKITPDGLVSLFANLPAGSFPEGLAFDGSGNLYTANGQTFQISKITPDGTVSVFATLPEFTFPRSLVFDDNGNLCVNLASGQIVKIAQDGTITPFTIGAGGSQYMVAAPVLTLSPIGTEGGFSAGGKVWLNIPASSPAATVLLSSSNSSLVALPASLTLPQGVTAISFAVQTAPVTVTTVVPITATYNGTTVSANVTLSPAPVISISGLSGTEVGGGNSMPVTVTLNNFPRFPAGAVISLTSSDTGTLQIPATVTVPYGAFRATVMATTSVVSTRKSVTLTAAYNGSTFATTVFVRTIPKVTITQADYFTDTHEFKVAATTTTPATSAIMTFGGSPDAAPLGTMQFETSVFKGSVFLGAAPVQATVWDSLGGAATVAVRLKTSAAGGGGATTTYKLTLVTNGKGTVTASPAASSYAAGTVVTLTATPAAGSPWIGWSGAVSGTTNPTTVTITKDTSITANFR